MSANGSATQGRGVIESPFLEAFTWEGAPAEGLVSARLGVTLLECLRD